MCDPVSATVAVAGLAASAVAKNNATNQQNRNMQSMQTAKENAYTAGIKRQQGYTEEAGNDFRPVIEDQGATAFNDKLAENTQNRVQAFSDNTLARPDYVMSDNAPSNVTLYADKAFADAGAKTTRDQVGSAVLGGYGDAAFNQGLVRNNFSRAFGNLTDKAGRDAGLIGLDMQSAAKKAFKAPSAWVGFMGDAGQAATMYGAAGAPGAPRTGEGSRPSGYGSYGPQSSKTRAFGGEF